MSVSAATVRRVLVGALAVGVSVAAWYGRNEVFGDYLRVWSAWGNGSATRRLSMWGLSLLWWGRIGKLLQFTAGLAVVLDLVKTESLRAFGERASAGWQRRRDYFRFLRLARFRRMSQGIFWSLHDSYEMGTGRGQVIQISYLSHRPKPVEQRPSEIDEQVLADFQGELLATLFRHPHETPRQSAEVAYPIIYDFLNNHLPTEMRVAPEPLARWERWNTRFTPIFIFVPYLLVWLGLLLSSLHYWKRSGLVVLMAGAASFPLLLVADYIAYLLLWAILAPVAGFARLLAWILDQQRPAYSLRWAALILFIIGFHFDLLSS